MADLLVRVPLWPTPTAIANAASLTSPPIYLQRMDFESLLLQVTSVAGAADVKVEYAISEDGVTFGSFDDEPDILASSGAQPNPEGLHTLPGVTIAAPWMKLKITDLASTGDSLVTAIFYGRETPKGSA